MADRGRSTSTPVGSADGATGPSPYPAAFARRLLTIPTLFLALVVMVAASPVLVLVAALVDLTRRAWAWPTVRLVAFLLGYLAYEAAGVVRAGWIWLTQPLARRSWIERNHRLQMWWLGGLMRAAGPVLGLRLAVTAEWADGRDGADLGSGPMVVLSRHVSIVDALLPAAVFGLGHDMALRYTLASGLRLDPCLDIAGHRLPNHFIDRRTGDGRQLEEMQALSAGMGEGDVAVIFPEGGLFSAQQRDRALERVAESDVDRAARFAPLTTVLPPRVGGSLALLRGAPDADVVVLAHHGFEPLASLKRLWRVAPLREPVRLRLTRHRRETLPTDDAGLAGWIDAQWAEVHGWVAAQHAGAAT